PDSGREPGSHVYQTAGRGGRDKLWSAAAMERPQRLLLLIPTTTYRTEDFVEAARTLDVDLVIASDRPNVMSGEFPDHLLTLPFGDPARAAAEMRGYAARRPLDAVVPVDDATTVVASAIGEALGLRVNPLAAAQATRNKRVMRERLAEAAVPSPAFTVVRVDEDPRAAARRVAYPCVLKPLVLSASRGVIRADDEPAFVAAFERVRAILGAPEVAALGEGTDAILVEAFVPGGEVALEGLLERGALRTLAVFDKPDPLDGPFFEETIYVTPSRHPEATQAAIADVTARGARALGLSDGAVHAELRLHPGAHGVEPVMLEIAARSIGGLCGRTLRFGTGMSLEELILRAALGRPVPSFERQRAAAAVMMIPIPRGGVLEEVQGLDEARAVASIEDVTISLHKGQEVVPLPEGSRYLGFIFSRASTPDQAEAAVREAHRHLRFVIR
ncbi:MAG TPA: ATP-grasp domain-containing protein, partial [Methylomirabilota bacterium]|nr:ATP-grasp domain-containing protein [Methylomirabilota bacterium]